MIPNNNDKSGRVSVRVDKTLADWVEEAAAQQRRGKSDFLRLLLEDAMQRYKQSTLEPAPTGTRWVLLDDEEVESSMAGKELRAKNREVARMCFEIVLLYADPSADREIVGERILELRRDLELIFPGAVERLLTERRPGRAGAKTRTKT